MKAWTLSHRVSSQPTPPPLSCFHLCWFIPVPLLLCPKRTCPHALGHLPRCLSACRVRPPSIPFSLAAHPLSFFLPLAPWETGDNALGMSSPGGRNSPLHLPSHVTPWRRLKAQARPVGQHPGPGPSRTEATGGRMCGGGPFWGREVAIGWRGAAAPSTRVAAGQAGEPRRPAAALRGRGRHFPRVKQTVQCGNWLFLSQRRY